jgi:hypothetical protein
MESYQRIHQNREVLPILSKITAVIIIIFPKSEVPEILQPHTVEPLNNFRISLVEDICASSTLQ